jgi:hypothetical protein
MQSNSQEVDQNSHGHIKACTDTSGLTRTYQGIHRHMKAYTDTSMLTWKIAFRLWRAKMTIDETVYNISYKGTQRTAATQLISLLEGSSHDTSPLPPTNPLTPTP